MNKKTVLMGLSGGVDSSLAALLLKQEGYNLIGVTMTIYTPNPSYEKIKTRGCYGCDKSADREAAKTLAAQLDIPYHTVDCSLEYKEIVLKYFKDEYLAGRTPNPCVKCNQLIKFSLLPEKIHKKGIEFDYFATGHYARIEYNEEYDCKLIRMAADAKKDQSYFLYRLNIQQLEETLFPLGSYTKQDVRRIAKEEGIAVHDKTDSQDFYDGDYNDLIGTLPKKGNFVDENGIVLGTHDGYWNFTIGQRKGTGIASSSPLYVTELRPNTNEVVLSNDKALLRGNCAIGALNFFIPPENLINKKLHAKIRSSQTPVEAVITYIAKDYVEINIEFIQPQRAISPGQSCVLYDEDYVMGGGIIL